MSANPDMGMPEGLSEKGVAAYKAVRSFLSKAKLTYTGGCKLFYSPQEWKARGEEYGHDSLLIIVYDGAAAKYAFNSSECAPARHGKTNRYEQVQAALEEIGLVVEECTSTYSAVYVRRTAVNLAHPADCCPTCNRPLPGA